MQTRSTLSERHPAARVALLGVGALLLAGVTACGSSSGGDQTPSATTGLPANSTATSESVSPITPATATEPVGSGAGSPVTLEEGLIEQTREQGMVSVIVTLDIPYRPEAELASPVEVEAQRTAIAAAQDELAASIPDATVTTRMTLFPQIVLSVDETALRQLAESPLVRAIEDNSSSAPTN